MTQNENNPQGQTSWFSEYVHSLKLKEVEQLLDLFFFRPLAFLLVKAIYRTNIRPNHLTIAAILMGIIAGLYYSIGTPAALTIGALFYMAFNILDCSDGQLARLKNNGTTFGRILDGMADLTATIAVFVGLAFGFANHQENVSFWWIMLSLTGISNVIHCILVDFYRNKFLDYSTGSKNNFEDGLIEFKNALMLAKQQKGKWFERIMLYLNLRYSSLQSSLVASRNSSETIKVDPQEYYRKNRLIMRLWLFVGPSSQITCLIICSFFHRIDLFVWITLIGFNGLTFILWIVQKIIESTYKTVNG